MDPVKRSVKKDKPFSKDTKMCPNFQFQLMLPLIDQKRVRSGCNLQYSKLRRIDLQSTFLENLIGSQ